MKSCSGKSKKDSKEKRASWDPHAEHEKKMKPKPKKKAK